jgi:hypothetical protein
LGGGILFNCWSENRLTNKGKTNDLIIKSLKSNYSVQFLKENWKRKKYDDVVENLRHANIKKYSKCRLAILFGLLYEFERAFFEDSISTDHGKVFYSYKFDGTAQLKWEVRPTFDFNFGDNVSLKIRMYLKMPMPGNIHSSVEYNGIRDSRCDYFIDFPVILAFKMNNNMSLSIDYRLLYDNAPQRKYILIQGLTDPVLIMPNQMHKSLAIRFNYSF